MRNRVGKSNRPEYEKEIGAVHVATAGLGSLKVCIHFKSTYGQQ
jgi:hypothetical protein